MIRRIFKNFFILSKNENKLIWLIRTPFGKPVDPEVYKV